ncbi:MULTISPECIES: HypC/HybG/HupF family hydrogenase formation chaperone [Desulfitobacterium]|uniref:Hydrogenase maturation protein HypC n=1 Tax=Desulfitobacterium dehalogenans (strain ATCC 51507 / DSM 9161 / JW/IU-DC1) TaxID=756499 RepID=I4ABL3_DESDJ|nr:MULTISPECIES: HypC/HybG/HupF family hydrogenase formation chaperone [Desulfitobacterium]AFM01348.1 Hydrogenase maturation protein HypC [Desulfitobacterium dehalogenans ATCC 51507]
MCIAIPARVVSIDEMLAKVDMMGNERIVGTHLVPEVQVGDYVLVHAGFAIEIVDQQYAKETEELLIEEANAREEL